MSQERTQVGLSLVEPTAVEVRQVEAITLLRGVAPGAALVSVPIAPSASP